MGANYYYQWDWIRALSFLQRGRGDKTYRTVPSIRATSIQRLDHDVIALQYHATHVISWHSDGTITLRTGGYQTVTTKARINAYSPHSVYQDNGLWYIRPHGVPFDENAPRVLFFDGIQIKEGAIQNPRPVDDTARREECKRVVDRLVSRYIKGYIGEMITRGAVDMDTGGDCWYCLMRTVRKPTAKGYEGGVPLGDAFRDVTHILDHMREGYYVPSLLLNAIAARNYGGGVAFVVMMTDSDIKRHLDGRGDGRIGMARDSLRAYLRNKKIAMVEALIQEGGTA